MWNPYVTTKATAVMKGHTSAVTHIVVNSQHVQVISVGKDKVRNDLFYLKVGILLRLVLRV